MHPSGAAAVGANRSATPTPPAPSPAPAAAVVRPCIAGLQMHAELQRRWVRRRSLVVAYARPVRIRWLASAAALVVGLQLRLHDRERRRGWRRRRPIVGSARQHGLRLAELHVRESRRTATSPAPRMPASPSANVSSTCGVQCVKGGCKTTCGTSATCNVACPGGGLRDDLRRLLDVRHRLPRWGGASRRAASAPRAR